MILFRFDNGWSIIQKSGYKTTAYYVMLCPYMKRYLDRDYTNSCRCIKDNGNKIPQEVITTFNMIK